MGKVSFGRTQVATDDVEESVTEIRVDGKAVGRILSRDKPTAAATTEYQVEIEGEETIRVTTLSSAKIVARRLLSGSSR